MDLTALYAAVPAAEEEDLLEEVREERVRAYVDALLGEPVEPVPQHDEPDEELPPLPQVLGLLEHRLGARVLPD